MSTKVKSIMVPTLTESFKKTKAMIKWWMENTDVEGNIKITTEDIIKQKEKEFGKELEFAN